MPTQATHVWKPSIARTAILHSFIPEPRGSASIIPPLLTWPIKDPTDVLDYRFDITPAVLGNDGDGIATLDIVIDPANPGDLTLDAATADGNVAVLWLSSGQSGTLYTISITVTTLNGRTINRSVQLPVHFLSIPPTVNGSLLTDTGTMVTEENGSPILVS